MRQTIQNPKDQEPGVILSAPCGIKKTLYLDRVYEYPQPVSPYDVHKRDKLDNDRLVTNN